jgi:hypothetical protein
MIYNSVFCRASVLFTQPSLRKLLQEAQIVLKQ